MLIFLSPLFSDSLYIEKEYCITQDTLDAAFFGQSEKENFTVIAIPKGRTHYTVPSSQIITPFQDKNISVIDSSEGVVIFKRNCSMMGKIDEISTAFLKKFQQASPYVIIENKPLVSAKASLPADFERYKLSFVSIPENTLKKSDGSFLAVFKVGNREKKIYFNYRMNASIEVFKAKRNLLNGKILLDDDYESVLLSLEKLPSRAILGQMPQNVMIKNNIKEGQILSENFFDAKKDVSKKETIKAFLKEESLVIEVQATLLEDGNIGEIVKIKTEQGKILNAKIISPREAMIVE